MKEILQRVDTEGLADVHTHLREGEVVASLIAAAVAGGADVLGAMPNTIDGLTTARSVVSYIDQAKRLVLPGHNVHFMPFVMITEKTTEKDIDECITSGIKNSKVYPYMRTTRSENGVVHYGRILPIIKYCGKVGMKCHFHPEHPSMIFGNREAEFAFLPIMRIFLEETDTTLVWEHGTDARCIPHWEDMATSGRFAVTLTAHHLATNEDLTFGDVRSVCKPPIKTEGDRRSLVDLVARDYSWVMAGGDVAFHPEGAKHVEKGCCACGSFTGPFLLPLYAHVLEKLFSTPQGTWTFRNFTSRNARAFHRLPQSLTSIKLVRDPWQIPLKCSIGTQTALPFWAGQTLNWRIVW